MIALGAWGSGMIFSKVGGVIWDYKYVTAVGAVALGAYESGMTHSQVGVVV